MTDNPTDKLFSNSFKSFEMNSAEDEWNDIASKVIRRNFLQHGLHHFNIYYMTFFISLVAITTYASISTIHLSNKVKELQKELIQTSLLNNQKHISITNLDTLDKNSITKNEKVSENHASEIVPVSNTSSLSINSKSELKTNNSHNVSSQNSKEVLNSLPTSKNLAGQKDTIKSTPKLLKTDSTSIVHVRKIVKTIVVKPNKVIIHDTVLIAKRNK